jgi:hypothetical protein
VKYNLSLIFTILTMIFTGISCSPEEINPVDPGVEPFVSRVMMQQKWNNINPEPYKIEVWVTDPQGIRNIKTVRMIIIQDQNLEVVLEDSLLDDGAYKNPDDGDVLAGDGIFSNRYRADNINALSEEVAYTITIEVTDEQNHQSQLFSHPLVIGSNRSPSIWRIEAPDSLSVEKPGLLFSITVSDSDGISDVVQAYFESKNLNNGYTKFEQYLYNDGDIENHGDEIPGDSIFATKITSDFSGGKSGDYDLNFYVQDSYGEENIEVASHKIYIGNLPPVLEEIIMPDTIHIPTGSAPSDYNYKMISAQVSDPEGLSSIDSVYFYSRKPEGEFANNGRPFVMADNGRAFDINSNWLLYENYGDRQAGDGIYAYALVVRSDFEPGTYTFIFYVRDKAGNLVGPMNREIKLISDTHQNE